MYHIVERENTTVRSTVSTSTAVLLALAIAFSATTRAQKPVNHDAEVLADFKARVDKYVDIRKKADDSAPPLKKTDHPGDIKEAQQGLVERIGAARAGATQGEIFTPEIAALFRNLLRPETKEPDTKALLNEKKDRPKPGAVPFKVNAPYPEKEPLATMPPDVLARLPQLPKDVEYRFVDKHLILRDARANTIIDFIPNAIP
jgi:hypothetical protein